MTSLRHEVNVLKLLQRAGFGGRLPPVLGIVQHEGSVRDLVRAEGGQEGGADGRPGRIACACLSCMGPASKLLVSNASLMPPPAHCCSHCLAMPCLCTATARWPASSATPATGELQGAGLQRAWLQCQARLA